MIVVTKPLAVFLAATMALAGLAGCADVHQDPVSTAVGAPLDAPQAPAQANTAPPKSVAF